ncbi:hypothetical protein KIN20_021269 [Parelaphostrongylus tenuis]|uniref:SKP1 component POZ domain-containing protein n=1 Tax=Parelaphostrongylus tenuis TaxID=148309 RepID=A0AAD5N479_PARTN|nr:hypothetical protein KIN20_021269 [Parelaphostrongylus tenuis]
MSTKDFDNSSVRPSTEKTRTIKMCKMQTSDSQEFEVSLLFMSKAIKTLLGDLDLQDDDTPIVILNVHSSVLRKNLVLQDHDEPIPLLKVNSEVMRKVLLWCENHLANERSAEGERILKEWDDKFFNVDQAMLFDLIMVHYKRIWKFMFTINLV